MPSDTEGRSGRWSLWRRMLWRYITTYLGSSMYVVTVESHLEPGNAGIKPLAAQICDIYSNSS